MLPFANPQTTGGYWMMPTTPVAQLGTAAPQPQAAIPIDFWNQALATTTPQQTSPAGPANVIIQNSSLIATPAQPAAGSASGASFVPSMMPIIQQQQPQQQQIITVLMQYGWQRELVVVARTDDPAPLELFRQRAHQIVERQHQSPKADDGGQRCGEDNAFDIQLFFHDHKSSNLLSHLVALNELDNGSVVEIIRVDRNSTDRPTRPHALHVESYKAPTFCGLIKQGLCCENCRLNFHKRCAYAPRNECAKWNPLSATNPFSVPDPMAELGSNNTTLAQPAAPQAYQLPHTLSVHSYKTPTVCKVCDKLLVGLIKQGLKCRDCKVNVHKKCAAQLPLNCYIPDDNITPTMERMLVNEDSSAVMVPNLEPAKPQLSMQVEGIDTMIPLARLPGSAAARSINQRVAPLCEGWMVHFELRQAINPSNYELTNIRRLKHYWVLTGDGTLSLYNEYNDGVNPYRVYKTIQLADILSMTIYEGPPLDPKHPAHCFEIRTLDSNYCVGENLESFGEGQGKTTKAKFSGGSRIAATSANQWLVWFQTLKSAWQPPKGRSITQSAADPILQISQFYQVRHDAVLGSGQFGTVYSAVHRQSKREVAVKIIQKDRFAKKATKEGVDALKSEVAILQAVDHHGIIKLESMYETEDKIYVVMERMNGDMLEMILSQATGRLDERCTKFLLIQILQALRYLHVRDIAHCDLKPENVLLDRFDSNFPQTKLCDFGYARFIGESQFRKTIVGTPAYLAPEVLKKKGYNKSLDIWSVGVIIYVTLSGTFPFNEGEEISQQIQNAAFMFPADPWQQINADAINLIQSLLKLEISERMPIDACLQHTWLKDDQMVFSDLRALEARLGMGHYLTEG